MVRYVCQKCSKIFSAKIDYTRHINRKKPCEKNEINQNKETNQNDHVDQIIDHKRPQKKNNNKEDNICLYCKNEFTNKSHLTRHIKSYCKVKKQEDNKKEEIYQKLLEENKELKKEREEFKKELEEVKNEIKQMKILGKTINNHNPKNCVIHNGDNNNIVIVAHGREDLDKINVKYILEALKRGTSCIPVITERIHFNQSYPEYQNVYISNMNQKYGMIYDGKEWKLKDKDTIIEDLYEKKFDFLDENFENIYEQLSDSQQKAFKRFLDIHEKADTDKQSKKIIDKIKQDLKLLLYNNKKIPIDNYSKITTNENIEV